MRISLFILLLVLSSSFLAGQAHFCVKIAGSATEQAGKMVTLQSGKSFQCGTSAGSLQLNASNVISDSTGIYLCSINSQGSAEWIKKIPYNGIATARALAVVNNQLYLCGELQGSIIVGSDTLTSLNGLSAFVMLFDTLGNPLWAKQISTSGSMKAEAILINPSGDGCILAGSFTNTITVNSLALQSQGAEDYYKIHFTAAGQIAFYETGGGTENDGITALTTDSTGALFLGGYFSSNALLGGANYTSAGGSDIFVAKQNALNSWVWTKTSGSPLNDRCNALTSNQNTIAATGFLSDSFSIDGIQVNHSAGKDAFLWLLNSNTGTSEYFKPYGETGDEQGLSLVSAPNGNLFLAGTHTQPFYADAFLIQHQGAQDAFIFELNGGNFIANFRCIGSQLNDSISGIAFAPNNSCYASGNFQKHCTFGNTAMSATLSDSYCMSFFQQTSQIDDLTYLSFHTANSGLASNNINHISVDALNRLWVATNDEGLSVFNGTSWINYNNLNSPLPNKITTTFHAADSSVYIGTETQGLFVFDGLTWLNYNTGNSQIGFNHINTITSRTPNIIWMGNPDSGLVRLNPIGFGPFNTSNSTLASNFIRELDYDTAGGTWVATNNGISRFFQGSFTTFNSQNSNLPGDEVISIHSDRATNLLYANTIAGISKYNGSDWQPEDLGPAFIAQPINEITVTDDAILSAGSKSKGGTIRTPIVQRITNTFNAMYENEVKSVVSDTSGSTIWMATSSNGLVIFTVVDNNVSLSKTGSKTTARLAPNPSQNYTQLLLPAMYNNQKVDVLISDVSGRIVLRQSTFYHSNFQIDVSNFHQGHYLVQISSKSYLETIPLVILK